MRPLPTFLQNLFFWGWSACLCCLVAVPAYGEPAWMQPSSFRYDPTSRIDPFVPCVRTEDVPSKEASRPLTPLEGIDITQLKVVGILWHSPKDTSAIAMIELPDGKGCIVRKGMRIGLRHGIVEAITPSALLVREAVRNNQGKKVFKKIRIFLHEQERGSP